jgi:CheY-like chemotaxis protein
MTVQREIASAIWSAVGGTGAPPPATHQAARDLIKLYEALNHASVEELVRRFPDNISGDDLAWFALTPGPPATQAIYVPTFTVALEGNELVWDGGTRHERNPGAGNEVLLIEDEPMQQKSTSRMIRKIFPNVEIVLADNADAAIANLQHHQFVHVVSDVDILGDKSGIDVFRWVEANQPDMVDRYTFFTGNTYAEQVHSRVVMKPAGLAELRAAILGPGTVSVPVPARSATRRTSPMRTVPPDPLSPRAVAAAVMSALPSIREEPGPGGRPRGRYGARKVFIAAIWRQLQGDPMFSGMTLEQFKQNLIQANRSANLVLARADLVGAMDRQEVAESEIEDRGATYHFVLDQGAKEPWE